MICLKKSLLKTALVLVSVAVAGIASAAKPWLVQITMNGGEHIFGNVAFNRVHTVFGYEDVLMDGVFGPGLNGTVSLQAIGSTPLVRTQAQSGLGFQSAISGGFFTGYTEDSFVDINIQWVGVDPAPAMATLTIQGTAHCYKSYVGDADGTSAQLDFNLVDLIAETNGPTVALATAPLAITPVSDSKSVTGSVTGTVVNGFGHYRVNLRSTNALRSPGSTHPSCALASFSTLNLYVKPL